MFLALLIRIITHLIWWPLERVRTLLRVGQPWILICLTTQLSIQNYHLPGHVHQKLKKQYRKIRGVDPIEFRNDVMASTLFSSPACNVNDLCDQYDRELSKVVDVHAPLKTRFVTSRPSAPWYSEEIAAEKRKRRKLERRLRKSGTEADKLQYADQCSRVRKLLKSSKMSYHASRINENKSDSKVLFNTIDPMLHRTPQNHYPSCGSPKELCDKFAHFFCDKIVTIRHQLDTLSITNAPAFPLIDDAIITCELSEFSPTSEDELSGLVKKIAAKSCSLDPVPASLLRYCIDDLLPIIKSVVNLSFNSVSMPSSIKNAVLSPLLKKPSLDFEIFLTFDLYLTWSFCLRLLKKLQPCVWRIICVITIWMKVSSLLIRNTTVVRQRFYVFKMIYCNQSMINNASFSCC